MGLMDTDVVFIESPSSHKRMAVRGRIEAGGASLSYLPPYCPDFNPMKEA